MIHLFKRQVQLIFFMNFILFISCSKENSTSLPTVRIISPVENQTFKIGDTINLEVQISDKRNVNRVDVKVKDENTMALYQKTFQTNSNSFRLEHTIVLSDPSWKRTNYLDIRAFNEQGYGFSFRYFSIESDSASSTKLIAFSSDDHKTSAYLVSESNSRKLNEYTGDLLKSTISSTGGELFVCGKFNAYINSIDTGGDINWRFAGSSVPSVPYFADVVYASNTLLASATDGRILGFDPSGNKVIEYSIDQEYKPGKLFWHEDLLIYEKIRNASGQVLLRNDFYPGGVVKGEVAFPYGRIAMFESTNWNKVLITSNDNGQHYILEYNSETHFIETLYSKQDDGDFGQGVSIGGDVFLMVKGDHLYKFDRGKRLLTLFKSDVKSQIIRFDSFTNLIWYSSENHLIAIDESNASVSKMIDVGFDIESFELVKE